MADAAEHDTKVATAFGRARLLVSGSDALPPAEYTRIERFAPGAIITGGVFKKPPHS
jgi:hypothetical protein